MKNKQYPIKSGLSTAKLFWPEFKVVDDLVFFGWCAPDVIDFDHWHDKTEIECSFNHVHILDCFSHEASLSDEPWWNSEHPDFKAACELGKLWAEAISYKLKKEFPERNFYIYYTEQDNPIVRFHQKHVNEAKYMSPETWEKEINCGQIVVHVV
jgi:hypothetical protein